MIFRETTLAGAFVIDPEPVSDDRGFFARTWCGREFAEHGLEARLAQASISFNKRKGTLRGMHFQVPPHEEIKLVRCTLGAIRDVIIDLRPGSPTFGQWFAVDLSAENRRSLYIPRGFAHGFQTLEDATEVFYMISEYYQPGAGTGLRHDDPAIGIDWPLPVTVISDKDASWEDFGTRYAGS